MPMLLEVGATGGDALNSALQANIAPGGIFAEFVKIMPWVGAMVGVGFLLYEGRKLIKGAAKGKVRL